MPKNAKQEPLANANAIAAHTCSQQRHASPCFEKPPKKRSQQRLASLSLEKPP